MRIAIRHGLHDLELELAGHLLGHFTGPEALPDPADAVREALERPFHYPPLRRALTPGDHVAVLVDEGLPDLAALLVPLLDHIDSAGVEASSVTVICPTTTAQTWIDGLPERHEEIHVEVHDPKDRRRSSYLATTSAGRRLYLNRSAVDADQFVVLSERRYDHRLGYAGGEGAIFPALADESTLNEAASVLRTEVPGDDPWPLRKEAIEVSWLLGQPFHVQAIASRAGGIAHVVAGAGDATREGQRLLDRGWRPNLARRADIAIVSLTGDPATHTFSDLAEAVASAARVVRPEGRIVLLADAAPPLGPGGEMLLRAGEPRLALTALEKSPAPDSAAILWAQSAAHARLSVLGGWPDETTEEMFATPLDDLAQVQRLAGSGDFVVLEDAHRMMPVVE